MCYYARKINSFPCKGQFNKSGNFSLSQGKCNSFKEVREGFLHIPIPPYGWADSYPLTILSAGTGDITQTNKKPWKNTKQISPEQKQRSLLFYCRFAIADRFAIFCHERPSPRSHFWRPIWIFAPSMNKFCLVISTSQGSASVISDLQFSPQRAFLDKSS